MSKGKIVIAEDNIELSQLIAARLRDEGYDVYQAEDGQKGLIKIQAEQPDLVILDLAMPRIPGSKMIRVLRDDPMFRRIPIIMLSAFVTPDMGESVEVPADYYMSKPFDEKRLIEKINELISRSNNSCAIA